MRYHAKNSTHHATPIARDHTNILASYGTPEALPQ